MNNKFNIKSHYKNTIMTNPQWLDVVRVFNELDERDRNEDLNIIAQYPEVLLQRGLEYA